MEGTCTQRGEYGRRIECGRRLHTKGEVWEKDWAGQRAWSVSRVTRQSTGYKRDYGRKSLGLLAHKGLVYEGIVDGEGMLFLWKVVGQLLYII